MTGDSMRERRPLISPDVGRDPRFLRHDLARTNGLGLRVDRAAPDARRHPARRADPLHGRTARVFRMGSAPAYLAGQPHRDRRSRTPRRSTSWPRPRERQTLAETFAALGDVSANLLHRVNNLVGIIPVRVQGVLEKRPALGEDAYTFRGAGGDRRQRARRRCPPRGKRWPTCGRSNCSPHRWRSAFAPRSNGWTLPEGITVEAEGLDSLPRVMAGEEQLRLVFFNLMENAADALAGMDPSGGRPAVIRVAGQATSDPLGGSAQRWKSWFRITVPASRRPAG